MLLFPILSFVNVKFLYNIFGNEETSDLCAIKIQLISDYDIDIDGSLRFKWITFANPERILIRPICNVLIFLFALLF